MKKRLWKSRHFHALVRALGWCGVHLRPNGNVSKHMAQVKKEKFTGVCGVQNCPKIKFNHQTNDVVSLDSSSQVNIFKQKDCVDKKIISIGKHCIQSSGDGDSCSNLRCKISGIKGDHMLDEESMINILSLADVTDSHRVTMGTSVDY